MTGSGHKLTPGRGTDKADDRQSPAPDGAGPLIPLEVGERVRAARPLRNDGTYPRVPIGEVIVDPGDVGYVLEITSFCGETYYAVEFVERSIVVGTRHRDLVIY